MSNTPIQITTDLSQVLERIEHKIDKLDEKFTTKLDKLSEDVKTLSVDMATVKTKIEGLEKRLDNQEFLNRGILIGLIVAVLAGLAKLLGFINNP